MITLFPSQRGFKATAKSYTPCQLFFDGPQDLIRAIVSTFRRPQAFDFADGRIGRDQRSTRAMIGKYLALCCSEFVTGFAHQTCCLQGGPIGLKTLG